MHQRFMCTMPILLWCRPIYINLVKKNIKISRNKRNGVCNIVYKLYHAETTIRIQNFKNYYQKKKVQRKQCQLIHILKFYVFHAYAPMKITVSFTKESINVSSITE